MTDYEKRDIRFSAILKALGGLAILLAAVSFASMGALRVLSTRFQPGFRRHPPPPEPRLQPDPIADLRIMRAAEDAELAQYAWVDRSRGVIRLPIERAMALLLVRGLPTRASSARARP